VGVSFGDVLIVIGVAGSGVTRLVTVDGGIVASVVEVFLSVLLVDVVGNIVLAIVRGDSVGIIFLSVLRYEYVCLCLSFGQ